MYNTNLFSNVAAIKSTFGATGMNLPVGPAKVIPGISEGFATIATTVLQNTPEGPAREAVLFGLYEQYLGVTGLVCSSWKHGNA